MKKSANISFVHYNQNDLSFEKVFDMIRFSCNKVLGGFKFVNMPLKTLSFKYFVFKCLFITSLYATLASMMVNEKESLSDDHKFYDESNK